MKCMKCFLLAVLLLLFCSTAQAATQMAYPTGDGDSINGTWQVYPASPATCWDKVDDPACCPDNATTYIYINRNFAGYCSTAKLFTFTPFSVPAGSTIYSLTIHYRAYSNDTDQGAGGELKVGSWEGSFSQGGLTSNWQTYSVVYTTNPATGLPWTVADVNGTGPNPLQQFGIYSDECSSTHSNYFTQIYAVVDYTPPTVSYNPGLFMGGD